MFDGEKLTKGRGKILDLLFVALILTSLLISRFYYFTWYNKGSEEKYFRLVIKTTYSNVDNKAWNLTEDDLSIGLFMNNSWQTVYLISSSHPIKTFHLDSDGNPIALLDIAEKAVLPGEKLSYNVTYKLVFRERKLPQISEEESGTLNDIPEDLKKEYCKPTSLWQSDIPALKMKAQLIAGNEVRVLTILKKFIKWIANNITYGSSEIPRYPNETFSQRTGDCDDQANLLVTFCRAVGIPAYLQLGCIYMPKYNRSLPYWSGHLLLKQVGVGWHGWAIVYAPPWGWLPVDLTFVRGNPKIEPIDAILHSAVVEDFTFQYMNITVSDYIAETVLFKDFLEANEFYIYEEDIMSVEEVIEKWTLQPFPGKLICPVFPSTLIIHYHRYKSSMRIVYIQKNTLKNLSLRECVEWRSLR